MGVPGEGEKKTNALGPDKGKKKTFLAGKKKPA